MEHILNTKSSDPFLHKNDDFSNAVEFINSTDGDGGEQSYSFLGL